MRVNLHVLAVSVVNVQQQVGVEDCRLFAIAFAVHAASGQNVEELEFDQARMREHLIKCFTQKRMLPFPTIQRCHPRKSYFRISYKRNWTILCVSYGSLALP